MKDILSAIGNTPLVKLKKIPPDNCAAIYVKLEYYNPTGSYKDRMALSMIQGAEKSGMLKPDMTVVECTGGSTGTSLAFVCTVKGYRFIAVTSDVFAKEKLQSIRLFGGQLDLIAGEGGKITPDLIPKMMARAEEISSNGAYLTKQFTNPDVLEGYRAMGQEILHQMDHPINVFCAAVGTAGMVAGVAGELKVANAATCIIVLEPASAPLISKGIKGIHKVEGIGVGFIPPFLAQTNYDEVVVIEESEARAMAKRLASEEGIFAGISSGMNVCAAIQQGMELGSGHVVVTVACDSGMKYLSNGLFD